MKTNTEGGLGFQSMPVLSKEEGIYIPTYFQGPGKKGRNVLAAFLLNVSRVHTHKKNPTYTKLNKMF